MGDHDKQSATTIGTGTTSTTGYQASNSSLSTTTDECTSNSHYSSLHESSDSLKSAILDSFRMHWAQAWSIMADKIKDQITMDDLSSIVNHLEQMISLLIEDNTSNNGGNNTTTTIINNNNTPIGDMNKSTNNIDQYDIKNDHLDETYYDNNDNRHRTASQTNITNLNATNDNVTPLLDFLFMESILDKILDWSEMAGEWKYAMYLEQLKLYELIISQLSTTTNSMILLEQSFHRPMIRLFDILFIVIQKCTFSFGNFVEIEKRLVLLLNTLCVAISQNQQLIQVLFLLIQFVHRDGAIGQQSRDALLLCLSLSRVDERFATYIVQRTDFCPLLATGLSALFSSLPRVLIGQSMSAEQFQRKDDLLCRSNELDQFLKCLDFCNAVAQIAHPIVQVQLLNYIYNGFLVSVIGPALHQNTLDEIITTTAYLDLFIRSISEPNLIRIFLEFLCFEQFDSKCIITTLISRIVAKSKLSLITLILFKTLLDLNCEDLQFELIFKYLLQGGHLIDHGREHFDRSCQHANDNEVQRSYMLYKQNWLSISAQKLFTNSLSHYLASQCPNKSNCSSSSSSINSVHDSSTTTTTSSSLSLSFNRCQCHSNHYGNYVDYLHEARTRIEQCRQTTEQSWKNRYLEPCPHVPPQAAIIDDIIFSDIDELLSMNNNDLILNDGKSTIVNNMNTTTLSDHHHHHHHHQFQHHYYHNHLIRNRRNRISTENLLSFNDDHHQPHSPIGPFLEILLERLNNFFENDVLTNLHLTGLFTTLCQSPHRLVLSLFFDETLSRRRMVPCLLHQLQKLSLDAQHHADIIENFESMFNAAKINLQSVPIGELNCQLLTSAHHKINNSSSSSSSPLSSTNQTPKTLPSVEKNLNKGLGALKSLFFRSSNNQQQSTKSNGTNESNQRRGHTRRSSNTSLISTNSNIIEVIPGGVRFFNQNRNKDHQAKQHQEMIDNKQNELIYNLIIFDEFLMEISAILIEQSIDDDFFYDEDEFDLEDLDDSQTTIDGNHRSRRSRSATLSIH
ncbi:hypothetical protein RDWZM_010471 [Blomia tropicalis]|uniref:FHF complex subunit HOOK-interacting protein C-terminal domain-containing protein n=1 Tax=Blomia tropicalis TaxID=40697 RepID=A0A9Q0LZA3_BLOTA|nr:hypothetical protein RDWZM_010471 [Blomia tropicalis]